MPNAYPLFKKGRKRKLLNATGLEVFFIVILQPALNFIIMDNEIMNFADLFNAGVTIVLIVGFGIYVAWKLWGWRKEDIKEEREDETLIRNDFIDTLKEALEAQKNLAEKSITLHVQDLKEIFLKGIKEALEKDEIDKEEIIKKLDHDFKHHHIAFNANLEKINNLKSRLERHKYDDILEEIRAEKTLEKQKAHESH